MNRVLEFAQEYDIPVTPKIRGLLSAMIASIGSMLPNRDVFKQIILQVQALTSRVYNEITQPIWKALSSVWRTDHSHKTAKTIQAKETFDKWNPAKGKFEKKV